MRVPQYRQLESNDCGPVCLQMIAVFYKKKYRLKIIKECCNMTRIGISLRDVVSCGKKMGFEMTSVNINIEEARRMPLPSILYLRVGHYVVLEKIKKVKGTYYYHIVDPDYGRIKMDENLFIEKWMTSGQGLAIVVAPGDNFSETKLEEIEVKEEGKMKQSLLRIIQTHKKSFLWIAFLTLIVVVTNWAMPLLLKKTIDDGIMSKNIGIVWSMLFYQFLFFLGFMFAGNISNLLNAKTSFNINIAFISDYFNKLIRLPMKFFDTSLRSDLIQRLGDQNRLGSFITGNLMSIAFSVLNVLVFSSILLIYNHLVFFIFMVFTIISLTYNTFFLQKKKHLDYSSFSIDSERSNTIYELVMGMSEVKINNAQKARIAIWKKLEDKMNTLRIKSIYLNYYMSNGTSLISRLRDITLTGLCAFLVIREDITMGTMMIISFLLGQLSNPINELIGFTQNVQDAKLSYNRLEEIYEKPDEFSDDKTSLANQKILKGIRFIDVSFKYAGTASPYVLKNINLEIPVGKTTAIVGASGSGKTTLLKLILGFYYPERGDVFLDHYKMNDINLDTWRDKCGVVMQDGRIFSGSIAENIAFSSESSVPEQLDYASRVANIDGYIKKLPMGFNTRIGETGIDLSGGEKQRIFIARAVYKNPQFMLFDEATSSLDATNEREIMRNLEDFYKGRTVVVIAHRLSTVKYADNIVFMDNGSIVEQGTHEELLNLEGYYYQLVKNQLELKET